MPLIMFCWVHGCSHDLRKFLMAVVGADLSACAGMLLCVQHFKLAFYGNMTHGSC